MVPTGTRVTPTRQSILVTFTSFSRSQRDDQVFSRGNVVGGITQRGKFGFRSYLVPTCTRMTRTRQSILVTFTSFSRSERDDQVFSRSNVVGGITRRGKFGFCSYLVPTCTRMTPTLQSILVTFSSFSRSLRENHYDLGIMWHTTVDCAAVEFPVIKLAKSSLRKSSLRRGTASPPGTITCFHLVFSFISFSTGEFN